MYSELNPSALYSFKIFVDLMEKFDKKNKENELENTP